MPSLSVPVAPFIFGISSLLTLFAHALVLVPILCENLTAWEASQNDQGKMRRYEPEELSKAMFLDTAGSASSLAHISAAQAQRLGSSRCLGGLAVEQTRLEGKKF